MPTRVWVVAGPEWKATAAKLGVVENQLPRWIQDEADDSITPLLAQLRSAVQTVDVQGGPAGRTGLRRRVAAGVGMRRGVSTKDTAYFRIFTSMAKAAESPIPRGLDSMKGWRHPLFGNKDHWFTSRPTRPGWFTDTIADHADTIERGIANALDRAEKTAG